MCYNFVLPNCRRPDISDGLKRLKCRTLIFVGDSSPFHSEALYMTSKLDRRYSALVEVCVMCKGVDVQHACCSTDDKKT